MAESLLTDTTNSVPTDAPLPEEVSSSADNLADTVDDEAEDALLTPDQEALALILEASRKVDRLKAEHEAAKEVASGRKKAYEAAVDELQAVITAQTKPLPLFDTQRGSDPETDGADVSPGRAVRLTPRQQNEQDDSWRQDLLIHALEGVSPGVLAALTKAELTTVGDLADFSAESQLVDIPGIGETKATAIEEAMDTYWARRAARFA